MVPSKAFKLIAAAVGLLLTIGAPKLPAQETAPYNVILLTADQMGADYMHLYGSSYNDTPNIDKFAVKGTVFTHMYASAPWTTPSFGAILTGLFPTVHGMTLPPFEGCGPSITAPLTNGKLPSVPTELLLSPHKPILPEMLKPYGMTTAADNANCWSVWDVAHRGWDDFKFFPGYQLPVPGHKDSSSFYLTAPQTTAWAEQWLKTHQNQRFFFWVHYMEPHAPFNEPATYDRFKTAANYPNLGDVPELHRLAKLHDIHAIRRMRELYAGKILYADHYIGQLLQYIHSLGLDRNTIVIFTSDHGELMYSHPRDFNTADHRSLYNADLHVPLIVVGPGLPTGKRLDDLVSNYDIVPTVMDLERLPPPARTDGVSLKPIIKETEAIPPNPYLFAEETNLIPQYSVRDKRYKVIESMPDGTIQCFDETTDGQELHNICMQIPQEAAQLKSVLDRHIQSLIEQAKSYPDWKNNVALAVLQQRDSATLRTLALPSLTIAPAPFGVYCQLAGNAWSVDRDPKNFSHYSYWAPPGPADASVTWRSDTPFTGNYDISIWYGGIDAKHTHLATDATYTVRFKGGTLSFPINQNQGQAGWKDLGVFHDPINVTLTNLADGPVVADTVRFKKINDDEAKN